MNKDEATILLIDDKEENLLSLKNILIDIDCGILTALSAEEGWNILLENDIACLLLDVHMPGMNGFDLAEKIRSDQSLKHIPIIVFVTAVELGEDNANKGYSLGAVDYLTKPLNPTMVRTKVDLYCQLYRKEKELKKLKY